jgi:ribose-phosphate pyrophosphokinase
MEPEKPEDVLLFKLTANPELANGVAKLLHIPLSPSEVEHFADGEALARPLCSVRGKIVYIIQSTATPVSERLMELLIFIDGLRNAKAKEINLVIPYYGFCRQDRIARSGEPITAKLVANLFETVGVNRIITVDLHTPQIQGFFSCPVDDLSPISFFGAYYRKKLKEMKIPTDKVTVVSPDHGSIHRARDLASELPNSKLAVIDKRRPAPNKAEVVNVVGEVAGQTCIIIDDIIDTAGTVLACAEALLKNGAKSVLVGGTHGVFSSGAAEKLLASSVKDIVITNTIERKIEGIHVISLASMIAGVIKATEEGTGVPDSWMDFY